MKIVLINLTKSDANYGLVSLATYLNIKGGYSDITLLDINYDDIISSIERTRPEIIGISSMTVYYAEAISLAKKIKGVYTPIIFIGGVHISTMPTSLAPCFDYGIIGEGEITTLELLNSVRDKVSTEMIEGIAYYKDNQLTINPPRPPIKDLDSIPIPNWDYANKDYFKKKYHLFKKQRVGVIMTSRGCPYKCIFCSTSRFWKLYRVFSVNRVCDEIEMLYRKHGVTLIGPHDDMLTVNVVRINKICDELEKRGLLGKITFIATARVNKIDDNMCLALKRLNVKALNFGFESGNDRVLKYLKKDDISLEQSKKAVLLCKKYKIRVSGSFIFASPTETLQEMKDTVEYMKWLKKNGATDLWSFVMTPFPSTPIWDIAKERGKLTDNIDWNQLNHHNEDNPMLLEEGIPKEEFRQVYYEGKKVLRSMEIRYWISRLFHDPLNSLLFALKDIKKLCSFLFSDKYKRI